LTGLLVYILFFLHGTSRSRLFFDYPIHVLVLYIYTILLFLAIAAMIIFQLVEGFVSLLLLRESIRAASHALSVEHR
jgi:hypothetical protein